MKLPADKLARQLASGLAPVYFVSGDAPLLVGEAIDAIRLAARSQGYDERESHSADARFDWAKLRGGLDNLSLFGSRKIVEVRLTTGKPGQQGSAAIIDWVAAPPADILLILSAPKLDGSTARSKWAQTLADSAVAVVANDPPLEHLPAWVAGRMRSAGLAFDPDAAEMLAALVEGNLLAAQQEINKLELLADGQKITADSVRASVADGARFDIYDLGDAAVGQDVTRATHIVYGLRAEGTAPALVMWQLAREVLMLLTIWGRMSQGESLARAMAGVRIWNNRKPLVTRAMRNHNDASMRTLVACAALTDRIVKGAHPGQPWPALLELVTLLAQPRAPLPSGHST
jgi:DNA polymerase-3 subunit delta